MKKCFKKALSGILTASMLISSVAFAPVTASAAGFTTVGGWNESLYAEWSDSNPDSSAVKVGYKLSSDSAYTYLSGDDLTYLVRTASTSGTGRVDIPGLKAGRYDLEVTDSTGATFTRTGIKVYANDRSGYAHFNATEGVGAYNNDGTPKDNAIIVYVTDENKDTIEVPGYEGKTWSYTPTSGDPYTRNGVGIGNILNNNMQLIKEVTITDNHPLIVRFIGKVNVPENLTPYNAKDPILGGSTGDNGNLAINKHGRNITLEGVGEDAVIEGWGFTFSKTASHPAESGKNFEVSNLTFENYPEDALGFQGEDEIASPIERVWVHNNTFYPGYCANPTESDKKEGDGSCDFKRGQYYTMAYNHYIDCHKTNLLGAGASDNQYYMTLHHNWYENVGSRQPLEAGGNVHIYSTYFDGATSTTVDARGSNASFLEENYYNNCKNYYGSRNNTCRAKSYNEIFNGGSIDSVSGERNVVTSRDEAGISSNGLNFPNGDAMTNFDTNPTHFYYDSANKKSDVEVLTPAADVPTYVTTYAGTLKAFPVTESGEIQITVKSGSTPITGAKVSGGGLTFTEGANGVYTAVAELGVAYDITVSKEGYSNVNITTTALANDGDVYTATADMVVDTDGYAVVKLEGGAAGAPVTGATVKLNDGTVLVDQGDGTYKSASQVAVGSYTATITNTGDYVAPSSAVTVTVKTTDEATVVELAKYTGTVNVTVTPAEGETNVPDLTKATVMVGDTTLTYSNGSFTGAVEIGNAYTVSVKVPGWNTDSITPATLTANKTSAVSANAVISYKGDAMIWNYTDGTNTLNATVTGNNWSSASSNPQTFEDKTLTKAIKMESSTSVAFNAETDGTLTVVMYSTNSAPSIKVDGTTYTVNASGATEIPLTAGSHTIQKGTSSTYLYYVQFTGGGSTPSETTTEATTVATTEATEATTAADVTTEATTTAPVEGDYVAAGSYSLNETVLGNSLTGTYNNIVYDLSAVEADHVRVKNTNSIKFKVAESMNLTITFTSNNITLNGTEIARANSPYTVALTPNTEYTISGATSSNARISSLVFEKTTVGPTETTESTTEATTEATTTAPVEGVQIKVDSLTGNVGEQITVPVRLTGLSTLASFDVNVAFDSANITVDSVTAGDMLTDADAAMSYNIGTSSVGVAGSNPADTIATGKDVLFNLVITPKAKGSYTLTVTVDELFATEGTPATATATAGTLTVEETIVGPVKGDADDNGTVEKADVTMVLQYVAGVIDAVTNAEAADVNEDSKVSTKDAYLIQKFINTGSWN